MPSTIPSDANDFAQRVILDKPESHQPTPKSPLPAPLEYWSDRLGCIPARPVGTSKGIEYVNCPAGETSQLPGREPTEAPTAIGVAGSGITPGNGGAFGSRSAIVVAGMDSVTAAMQASTSVNLFAL